MVNPITTVASVTTSNEATNKRSADTAHHHAGTVPQGQTEQASPRPQAVGRSSDYEENAHNDQETRNKTPEEGMAPQQQPEFIGEKRDFGLENGKLLVRVYSNDGRLLRETPPGYLPLNKPRVNIKV
ncbi:MAG: hypothetical protein SWH78_00315 [Thermodesulfobacteriota bacterium]|nr:hypothetical protein [Thermodesulfobacteriota bacterium]